MDELEKIIKENLNDFYSKDTKDLAQRIKDAGFHRHENFAPIDDHNHINPPTPKEEKYPMCDSQDAQIDCRIETCCFYKGAGKCSNISPAITLNPSKKFVCWSEESTPKRKRIEKLDIPNVVGFGIYTSDVVDKLNEVIKYLNKEVE